MNANIVRWTRRECGWAEPLLLASVPVKEPSLPALQSALLAWSKEHEVELSPADSYRNYVIEVPGLRFPDLPLHCTDHAEHEGPVYYEPNYEGNWKGEAWYTLHRYGKQMQRSYYDAERWWNRQLERHKGKS